jgi:hypothetical protein
MPTRLSITVDMGAAGKDGETRRAELVMAADAVERALQVTLTTQATSGNVSDRNGAVTGHWTYTPTAAA